ncbi:MAG: hypothetical protein DRG76_01015 [Deltaproteobacteria bacterium]|nr:MAG: hypothetical protein DRG76_01015 [Deltaproteobacteria bacterium]
MQLFCFYHIILTIIIFIAFSVDTGQMLSYKKQRSLGFFEAWEGITFECSHKTVKGEAKWE